MSKTRDFVCRGASYQVIPHPPSELGGFALRLAALAAGPLATLFKAQGNVKGGIGEMDLSAIDPQEVQQALIAVVDHISEAQVRNLFKYTTRAGKELENDLVYDEAYRGNWLEWYQALYLILKANGFLDFLASLSAKPSET